MAENDPQLLSAGEIEPLAVLAAPDTQLAFPFVATADSPQESRPVPDHSRREARSRNPGRSLSAPTVERPLEEVQLEHGVSNYLPPGKVVGLRLTENRYTILSVERGRECYRVRIHRMFAGAEPRLVHALARYVVHNDRRASAMLSEFIERHQDQIRKQPRRARRVTLRPRGRVHDLNAILARLNRLHFEGKLDVRITWGVVRKRGQQRSIKIGTYSVEDRLIRVHPVLDQAMVPRYFLDWIVFHEMLHGKHAIRRVGSRRRFHPPEFLRDERQFPDYERARLWEKANMDRLLGG
jgi:hypothetical protein